MVRVSVMYPNSAGVHFDMTYYLDRHMPMVGKLLGSALKSMNVDEGLAGGAPGRARSISRRNTRVRRSGT